jgi:hypothetical protein
MSNNYKSPSEVPTSKLIERLNELAIHVANGNHSEFYMRIPVECDRDADIVLSEAANRIEQQAAEIEALRGFALWSINNYDNQTFIYDYLDKAINAGLIDENGKPTALLTGVKE